MNKTSKVNVFHILLTVFALALAFSFITAVFVPGLSVRAEGEAEQGEGSTAENSEETSDSSDGADSTSETEDQESSNDSGSGSSDAPYIVELVFEQESIRIKAGDSVMLKVYAIMSDDSRAEAPSLKFKSSDKSVAGVSASGVLSTSNEGTVTIVAKADNSDLSCSCTVTVYASTLSFKTLTTGEHIITGINPDPDRVITLSVFREDIANETGVSADTVVIKDAVGKTLTSGTIRTGLKVTVNGVEFFTVIYGDTNGDGLISTSDTQVILDYLTGASQNLNDNRAFYTAADVFKNGKITIENALFVQRCYKGLETIDQ